MSVPVLVPVAGGGMARRPHATATEKHPQEHPLGEEEEEEEEEEELHNRSVDEDFAVGDVLGRGAFSVVRRATHRRTGQIVALKIIPRCRFRSDARAEMAVRAEIAVMRHLMGNNGREGEGEGGVCAEVHRGIMRMLDLYEDPSKVVLVLECLRGGDLFDRIVQRGHFSERDAAKCMRQIVEAVRAMHALGVLHRDLKPENLVYAAPQARAQARSGAGAAATAATTTGTRGAVTNRERKAGQGDGKQEEEEEEDEEEELIKITDFGLAIRVCDVAMARRQRNLVGTPGYVAPETLQSLDYTPACDVWSLGVILYILLCGYPPFYATRTEELFSQIKSGIFVFHPQHWSSVSEQAKDLVRQMLTVEKAQRIDSAGILSHPWIATHTANPDSHLRDAVSRIRQFHARRKFRAAAMACIWGARLRVRRKLQDIADEDVLKALPESQIERLKEEFQRAATQRSENTHGLSHETFQAVITKLGMSNLPMDRLFEQFDLDGNDTIDYREFLTGLAMLQSRGEKTVRFCFDLFDEDRSGFITREELGKVLLLSASDQVEAERLKAEQLAHLFETLDTNGDDRISYPEFRDGVRHNPTLMEAFFRPLQSSSTAAASPQDAMQMQWAGRADSSASSASSSSSSSTTTTYPANNGGSNTIESTNDDSGNEPKVQFADDTAAGIAAAEAAAAAAAAGAAAASDTDGAGAAQLAESAASGAGTGTASRVSDKASLFTTGSSSMSLQTARPGDARVMSSSSTASTTSSALSRLVSATSSTTATPTASVIGSAASLSHAFDQIRLGNCTDSLPPPPSDSSGSAHVPDAGSSTRSNQARLSKRVRPADIPPIGSEDGADGDGLGTRKAARLQSSA